MFLSVLMTWPNSLYPLGGAIGEEIEESRIIENAVDSSPLNLKVMWVHKRRTEVRKIIISLPKMVVL